MSKKTKLFLLFICIYLFLLGLIDLILQWYPASDGPPNINLINMQTDIVRGLLLIPIFLASICAYIVVPLSVLACLFFKGKVRSVSIFIGVVFLMCFLVNNISHSLAWKIRESSLERVSQRGEPIIQAIEAYRKHESKIPESLEDIVPEYIDEIPGTGIRAYPVFDYEIPKGIDQHYKEIFEKHHAIYELRVDCPIGALNYDCFIYWPSESYPDKMYGGVTELINKWAYVHE